MKQNTKFRPCLDPDSSTSTVKKKSGKFEYDLDIQLYERVIDRFLFLDKIVFGVEERGREGGSLAWERDAVVFNPRVSVFALLGSDDTL